MKKFIEGAFCGFLNGFFGSGGGVVAVPVMEREGCSTREAHASSVALIFVLCLVTAVAYGFTGNLNFSIAWGFLPYGVVGALCGAFFLKKIRALWLHRLFGAVIIVAAIRTLLI